MAVTPLAVPALTPELRAVPLTGLDPLQVSRITRVTMEKLLSVFSTAFIEVAASAACFSTADIRSS